MKLTTHDALMKAADAIERDGWYQHGYAPEPTEHRATSEGLPKCVMGALYEAVSAPLVWDADLATWCGMPDDATPAWELLAEYVGDPVVPDWNDAPERTAAEVVETLRAAAAVALTRESAAVEAVTAR